MPDENRNAELKTMLTDLITFRKTQAQFDNTLAGKSIDAVNNMTGGLNGAVTAANKAVEGIYTASKGYQSHLEGRVPDANAVFNMVYGERPTPPGGTGGG